MNGLDAWVGVVLVVFLAAAVGAGAHEPLHATYVGNDVSYPDTNNVNDNLCDRYGVALGGACITAAGASGPAELTVSDVSGLPVSGHVRFAPSAGPFAEPFCGSWSGVVPDGTTRVLVLIHGADVVTTCGAPGIAGMVELRFGP